MNAIDTDSPQATQTAGKQLAAMLSVGDCIALIGELGAGKTTFVRGLADGLGCDVQLVSSPTYVLCQEYPGRLPLFHVDLYRMGNAASELADLGIEDMLAEGVVVIEWADRATDAIPQPHRTVHLIHTGETSRRLSIGKPG
ncbi:MAG: tRNA (adenosine(37)-N6)-threonylcarbamoyltransferase complex ATPase subunit type 1 TsaE [Planctomycetes bacterium]|jgi:tRNA threonylcarbamoyladenosine biosynthesis protein TsaE|nr:tRNA (adenosine(37)-N6)-threonylcarbamoyltransferase complex ATPase subunit type 1 TsaE [Planctomycetota bacterium]